MTETPTSRPPLPPVARVLNVVFFCLTVLGSIWMFTHQGGC